MCTSYRVDDEAVECFRSLASDRHFATEDKRKVALDSLVWIFLTSAMEEEKEERRKKHDRGRRVCFRGHPGDQDFRV